MVMAMLERKFAKTFGIFSVSKILYVCRLFNGLEQSVIEGKWRPTGVPTIFRMIEKLNASSQGFKLILTAKDGFSNLKLSKNKDICFDGFFKPVTVLKNHAQSNKKPTYKMLREVAHLLQICKHYFLFRPGIVYFDHGNVWAAAIFARLTKCPVVFRVMGVYPAMRDAVNADNPSIAQRVLRWCYRSPFSMVVCTQDGSGVEKWLSAALDKRVRVLTPLNGLPKISGRNEIDTDHRAITVSFLGKLESAKGADVFVQAMMRVVVQSGQKFKFHLVGTGSLEAGLRKEINRSKHKNCFEITSRLENHLVQKLLQKTDIYVSLNKYGNLSNANLEAIAAGCCIVLPSSQKSTGIDVVTDQMLGLNAVYRLKNGVDHEELARAVIQLAASPERREAMSQNVLHIAKTLPDWQQRIDLEFNELLKLRATDG